MIVLSPLLSAAVQEELRQRLHLDVVDIVTPAQDGQGSTKTATSNISFQKIGAVIGLLVLISLVAGIIANLFEYLGYVEKREKKEAHVV